MGKFKITDKKYKRFKIVKPNFKLYRRAKNEDLKNTNTLFNVGGFEYGKDLWIRSSKKKKWRTHRYVEWILFSFSMISRGENYG